MSVPIRPILDRVVIIPEKQDEVTEGGIVLTNPKERRRGRIVAVGPGLVNPAGKRLPMTLKVGERVCYQQGGGQRLTVQGTTYVVLGEPEVLCVLEGA